MSADNNPYRGPFPFTINDEDLFFGREKETEELIHLIRNRPLTVLFGASGTGKTSLIHARLLPQLQREYFHPIYIRINFANKEEDPLHYVQKRIVEELKKWDDQLPDFSISQTLIDYAANNVIFNGLIKPVLFFDQFEELFTLGPKNDSAKVSHFIQQLADLIELRLPDHLKKTSYINNITSFRVLFSLRQDWVGYLDDFSHLIPSVLEDRYRLKKFSPQQALAAVMCPAEDKMPLSSAKKIINLIGTPALWRKSADFIDSSEEISNKEVDPFVLSLYCYQLYEESSKIGLNSISTDFIKHHHNTDLIRHYYEEKLSDFEYAKTVIEDKLLNESGKRLLISLDNFIDNNVNLKTEVEKIAAETGILRITGMGYDSNIEIVHDQLAIQIFESKRQRIARELLKEADEKNREAENLRLLAKKKETEAESFRGAAQKAKKTITKVIVISAILLFCVTGLVVYQYYQSSELQKKSEQIFADSLRNNSVLGLKEVVNGKSDTISQLKQILKIVIDSNNVLSKLVKEKPVINIKNYETNEEADSIIRTLSQQLENKKNDYAMLMDSVKTLNAILTKADSKPADNTNVLDPTNSNSPSVDDRLEISDINVTDFHPNDTKINQSNYGLDEVKREGIILKFVINRTNIIRSKIKVIFEYFDNRGNKIKLQSPISVNYGRYLSYFQPNNKIGRGKITYTIFYNNEQITSNSLTID